MENKNIIVIPTYNEELNLGNLMKKLKEIFPDFFILVIDDSPNDLTRQTFESYKNDKEQGNWQELDAEGKFLYIGNYENFIDLILDNLIIEDLEDLYNYHKNMSLTSFYRRIRYGNNEKEYSNNSTLVKEK